MLLVTHVLHLVTGQSATSYSTGYGGPTNGKACYVCGVRVLHVVTGDNDTFRCDGRRERESRQWVQTAFTCKPATGIQFLGITQILLNLNITYNMDIIFNKILNLFLV